MGQGPRTGGGFGFCPPRAGSRTEYGVFPRGAGRDFAPWGGGRGRVWGGGRFRGMGFGRGGYGRGGYGFRGYAGLRYPIGEFTEYDYPAAPDAALMREQELESLKRHANLLKQEMRTIQNRISQLEIDNQNEKK